jgi:phage-related protein
MGGAATWHFGVHYAGEWAAVAPGAGFVETAIFSKAFSKNPPPTWYEQTLWHYCNAIDDAANLFNTHVVAYSGEIDGQRAAAELMTKAMADEGMTLTHIIGPNTAHKYEPEAKKKVAALVDGFANEGRKPMPKQVKFTTWNLRFNQMDWVAVDGMEQEWQRARLNAEIVDDKIVVSTTNVSAFTLAMPAGLCPLPKEKRPVVELDGVALKTVPVRDDLSWAAHFRKENRKWKLVKSVEVNGLVKKHGLQGPIDDAFVDSFIMVRPTGEAMNEKLASWAAEGLNHAMEEWHLQFRGDARIKNDIDITAADMEANNLILWGDPQSNKLLARMARKLPIQWDTNGVQVGALHFSAETNVPVMIYPNPLNPKHYVVLNTGFTFCEVGRPSNALQVPVLPDYAIVNINVPLASRIPDGVKDAGFFDEQWRLPIFDNLKPH